ncbi:MULTISPECIES: porin family protein [Chryseobacterium]|nr:MULTISPECIES: outer membrane beta-barrel protein [Chryseobacterium]
MKTFIIKMKYFMQYQSIDKLLLSACFFFASFLCYSQNYPLKFGIKAGWNYSNVNAIDEIGERSGYLSNGGELFGGIALEKQISKKTYIQTSFLVSYTDRVTFLELPLYYKYNFYKKFSLLAGPKLNYIPDDEISQPYDFKRRVGISGDLGIDYKISNHFIIEGTVSKGFTKQYDDLILTYYDAKRNVYRLGVAYYF